VRSVRASGARPVYDLSVEGQPEFFAGGLLVHNCTFTAAQGERSPDRLDSLVWACTPFLNASFAVPSPAGRRDWAAMKDMDEFAPQEQALGERARRKIASAHGGLMSDAADTWSLEDSVSWSLTPNQRAQGD
jgi:hypothetical protein